MLNKGLYRLAIAFLTLLVVCLSVAGLFSIELVSHEATVAFAIGCMISVPVAVLLTLSGTLKKEYPKPKRQGIVLLTTMIAIVIFATLYYFIPIGLWGDWVTETIVYRNKKNPSITINDQVLDIGALGYGGNRQVEIRPVLTYFQQVTRVAENGVDTTEWKRVDEDVLGY